MKGIVGGGGGMFVAGGHERKCGGGECCMFVDERVTREAVVVGFLSSKFR